MKEENNTKEIIKKLQNIDTPEKARKYLAPRGHDCISAEMLQKAKDAAEQAKSDKQIIDNLIKTGLVKEIDGKVYATFPQCYCRHVKKIKGPVPKSYCYCTEAWVKHFFETAFNREIKTEAVKTVLWGDAECLIRADGI